MPSEGSRETGGLETAKGAVRERIGLARQSRHSRVQGTTRTRERGSLTRAKMIKSRGFLRLIRRRLLPGLADFHHSQIWSISRAVATYCRDE